MNSATKITLAISLFLSTAFSYSQNAPTITTQPTNQTVAAGTRTVFTVTASGTGPFSYKWRLNGTNLPGSLIATVAGNGEFGYSGDAGLAVNASLANPSGVAVDTLGNLFVADQYNNRIREIGVDGIITTLAGNGSGGFSGDGGPAANAAINRPLHMAVDQAGNLFIADAGNRVVREIHTNGIITTVAGGGQYQLLSPPIATNMPLSSVSGVAVDDHGNFFLSNPDANGIFRVTFNEMAILIAGSYGSPSGYSGDGGTAVGATLGGPLGLAADNNGNVFLADSSNSRIRKVGANGIISTVAGNGANVYSPAQDGGRATNASLYFPGDVAVDGGGNLFIADQRNNRIRKVDANGTITTVAGRGPSYPVASGYSGDGGAPTNAALNLPSGVAVDGFGNLFIADTSNNRVREVVSTDAPSLVLNNVVPADAGNYDVVVTGQFGSVTSSVTALTVVLPVQPAIQAVAVGGVATFSISVFGPVPCGFQWYFAGAAVAGQTNAVLTLTGASAADAGNYLVVVTNAYGALTSAPAALFIGIPATVPALQVSVNGGTSLTLQFTGGAPGLLYTLETAISLQPPANWQPIYSGAADANGNWTYADYNISANPALFYRVTVP